MYQEICIAEYGLTPLTAARAAAAGWPARANKIPSAGAYVAAVRRAQGWHRPADCFRWHPLAAECAATGCLHPDGRLLAALWRACPVAPRNRPRIEEWLAYWQATQPRPEVVGSSCNDAPEHAARAFRLGIPPHAYPKGMVYHLPEDGRTEGHHDRIAALQRLSRLTGGFGLPGCDVRRVRTADLRRLAHLPRWVLRVVECIPLVNGRVDWTGLRVAIEALKARLPVKDLLAARVPYIMWSRMFTSPWPGIGSAALEQIESANLTARSWIADVAEVHRRGMVPAVAPTGAPACWHGGIDPSWAESRDPLYPLRVLLGEDTVVHQDDWGTLLVEGRRLLCRVVNATADADGTFRDFDLRVPPWARTAHEAVAWTFGLPAAQYAPAVQS